MKEIKWFPGHMKNALDDIEKSKIQLADAILYVLDSRAPLSCMNPNVNKIVHNKPIIYVFNKIDLADEKRIGEIKKQFESEGKTAIVASANNQSNRQIIRSALVNLLSEKIDRNNQKNIKKTYKILVLGVPNTGKSSIINLLCGTKKTISANTPGVTRQNQWVRIDDDFMLLDTPGVLWPKFDESHSINLAFIGCLSEKEFDVSDLGYNLMEKIYNLYPKNLTDKFEIAEKFEEFIEFYDAICKKRGYIRRGNEIDYNRAGKSFLDDFRNGKFGKITLE